MGRAGAGGHPLVIGRYRVDGLLGRGAMGMVYLARDEAIERDVAIKTIHRELLERRDAESWVARFRAEVRAAGRCLHPNIVTVFEYGETDGVPYIVMECVEGRELRELIKAGERFSPANAASVLVQVLWALEHAHGQGVVHRDIKPANIILLADGQVKVADFGIARLVHGDEPLDGRTIAMGTPGYMAPEQFCGLDVDERADLYAAGVVFFEMLAGDRPFHRREDRDLPQQVMHDAPPRLSRLKPQLPPQIDAVLDRALAKSPADRFQSAAEMRAAIEGLGLIERELGPEVTVRRAAPRALTQGARPSPFADEILEVARERLAVFLGPIAKVLVRRAAATARNPRELYEALAAQIPSEADRTAFLAHLGER
ncbi:MAG: serine/threonine protein kinase [Deltaproteobacteria bacterium]|nr:serine/threonine protein kinase [Deltaproteobacteria bacterium]